MRISTGECFLTFVPERVDGCCLWSQLIRVYKYPAIFGRVFFIHFDKWRLAFLPQKNDIIRLVANRIDQVLTRAPLLWAIAKSLYRHDEILRSFLPQKDGYYSDCCLINGVALLWAVAKSLYYIRSSIIEILRSSLPQKGGYYSDCCLINGVAPLWAIAKSLYRKVEILPACHDFGKRQAGGRTSLRKAIQFRFVLNRIIKSYNVLRLSER